MNKLKILFNGILKENPTFILLLGMCPTLATTTSAINGMGMGLATASVLLCSNTVISLVKKLIPDSVRIPAYIIIIASFVTIVELCLKAWAPAISDSLGLFIPLIVVNCIILARAESFASKNSVGKSALDGLGMGLGFTVGLTAIGVVRELIGAGQAFGMQILPVADAAAGTGGYVPVTIFILAPGAFIVLACLVAAQNKINLNNEKKAKVLYDFLDQSSLFQGTVEKKDRSLMNVPFVSPSKEQDAEVVAATKAAGFDNLKGHKSVGGLRASIYNAMPKEGVEALVDFLKEFEKNHK